MGNILIVSILALRLLVPLPFLPACMQESVRTGQELDLNRWKLTAPQLQCLYETMHLSGMLPWYTNGYRYAYLETGQAVTFYPVNLECSRQTYEDACRRILDATVTDDMSPSQVARALHDYLIAHCRYDRTYTKFTPYDAIVQGEGVCSSYASAYMDLMNRAGVPCMMVESNTMGDSGHAWNLVRIGGDWYHVDVTWDDPDGADELSYRHFLKTDAEISQLNHHDWIIGSRLPQP